MISELIARVFQARNAAHVRHWLTGSYAEHVALGTFYDSIIPALDAIVENYQGIYGKIEIESVETEGVIDDIVTYLQEEMDFIEASRDEIAQGSTSIENLIDALTSIYSQTVFLLRLR